MKIKINEIGYVESPYITDATIELEITDTEFEKISTFPFNKNWRYIDGEFALEDVMTEEILRSRRERECFTIIDRSKLWYDSLTSEQYNELQIWYEAWLSVTETRVIPIKPSWLN